MNEQSAIRIFLVDDQSMIRAGFRSLLSGDERFQVVGDSGDPRAAIDAIGRLRPDIVLLDISMPGLSGLDAIAMIRKVHDGAKVIMLTHHEGESFVTQALSSGADGYLSKDSEQAELVLAIDAVRRGNPFISPKVAGGLLRRGGTARDSAPGAASGTRLESLTPREREVFQLLALGKSNKEIAKSLSTSLGTVKKHRENLQRKLNCHSTAEMALLAMREGLIGS
jgi:two-component system nitrate/nitrite response regulator NarL